MNTTRYLATLKICMLTSALLSGCATVQGTSEDRDPLEGVNRSIYSFNEKVDNVILEPVATGYVNVVPQPIRTGVSNFFANLAYPVVVVNDVLQGKFSQSVSDSWRFIVNSTVGVAGIFDVATHLDMPAHNEDFGQTLGKWGVGEGVYIVLPLLGPSTLRDTTGLVVDFNADLLNYVDDSGARFGLRAVKAIDTRARFLRAGRILDQAALDPYTFTREAYRQRRINAIYDGNPPPENFSDEFDDEIEEDIGNPAPGEGLKPAPLPPGAESSSSPDFAGAAPAETSVKVAMTDPALPSSGHQMFTTASVSLRQNTSAPFAASCPDKYCFESGQNSNAETDGTSPAVAISYPAESQQASADRPGSQRVSLLRRQNIQHIPLSASIAPAEMASSLRSSR